MNRALLDFPFRVLLITVSSIRSVHCNTAEMWIKPVTVWFCLFAAHWHRQRRRQNVPPDMYLRLVHSVIHTSPFNAPILWAATGLRKAGVGALKIYAWGSLTQGKLYARRSRMRLRDLFPTTKRKTATQNRAHFSRDKFFALKAS